MPKSLQKLLLWGIMVVMFGTIHLYGITALDTPSHEQTGHQQHSKDSYTEPKGRTYGNEIPTDTLMSWWTRLGEGTTFQEVLQSVIFCSTWMPPIILLFVCVYHGLVWLLKTLN